MSPEVIEGRGTTTSTYEYAIHLGALGHDVIFAFDESMPENSKSAIDFLKRILSFYLIKISITLRKRMVAFLITFTTLKQAIMMENCIRE